MFIHTHTHTYTHMLICAHIWICVCVSVCVCACVYTYMHIYIHIHSYACTFRMVSYSEKYCILGLLYGVCTRALTFQIFFLKKKTGGLQALHTLTFLSIRGNLLTYLPPSLSTLTRLQVSFAAIRSLLRLFWVSFETCLHVATSERICSPPSLHTHPTAALPLHTYPTTALPLHTLPTADPPVDDNLISLSKPNLSL